MVRKSKVPRGCFGVRDWNGDLLVFDPKAPITPGCQVLVYLRDDLRVRFVATFIHEFPEHGTIRLAIARHPDDKMLAEFDRSMIEVAKIVRVDRNLAQADDASENDNVP